MFLAGKEQARRFGDGRDQIKRGLGHCMSRLSMEHIATMFPAESEHVWGILRACQERIGRRVNVVIDSDEHQA